MSAYEHIPRYNILCFGDSNTFGTNPSGGRWGRYTRWPGRLQQLLGEDYYVVEEGFSGRTTVFNDPIVPFRCGRDALPYALTCHRPLDLVIIMLGTNDMKHHFSAQPATIARGAGELVKMVKSFDYGPLFKAPQVLLISPILVGENITESIYVDYGPEAPENSLKMAACYEKVAKAHGCHFLDAAKVAKPSDIDQLHMDAESHEALAQAVAKAVREIL